MKKPVVVIAGIAVAAVALLYFTNTTVIETDAGNSVNRNEEASAGPSQESIIKAMNEPTLSPAELDKLAESHVLNIRERHRIADEHTSAVIAGANEGVDPSVADERTAALEQSLIDSISSLTQQLMNEPELTTNTIRMLGKEEDPQTMLMIARAIGEASQTMGDKFPYDLLLEMAMNDPNLERRQAAMLALSYMANPPADLMASMAEITRSGLTADLRAHAIDTMGSWMSNNRELTASISDSLLEARTRSDDPTVRGMVLQTIGNMDSPLTPKGLEAMTDAVLHEPEALNRSLAAVALGSGASYENRESVLAALEAAYLAEPEINTQRHILTQITKASGADAEIFLRRLPTPNPLLAQDVEDYVQILSTTSHTDWGAVWDKKSSLDSERGTYPADDPVH